MPRVARQTDCRAARVGRSASTRVGAVESRRSPGTDEPSWSRVPAVRQIVSGTILMAPHGHSDTQMPQPLQ